MAVDKNEAPEGYYAEECLSCKVCAFFDKYDCPQHPNEPTELFCTKVSREDGCSVIFKKREYSQKPIYILLDVDASGSEICRYTVGAVATLEEAMKWEQHTDDFDSPNYWREYEGVYITSFEDVLKNYYDLEK